MGAGTDRAFTRVFRRAARGLEAAASNLIEGSQTPRGHALAGCHLCRPRGADVRPQQCGDAPGRITGTVTQGVAVTVPIGALTFLVMAIASGTLGEMRLFPPAALLWLAGQGVVHFVLGRICNYKSSQLMGVNLSAPVVQLQVLVAILLAVLTMKETFTVLQAIGSVMMLGGSLAVQHNSSGGQDRRGAASLSGQGELLSSMAGPEPLRPAQFQPKLLSGYLFGLAAAFFYGVSPLMARQAFLIAPTAGTSAGGCVAYLAATAFFGLLLIHQPTRRSVAVVKLNNVGWFLSSAVLVAISQGFVYASLALAPLLVVTPILQLSLIFRIFLSQMINKEHEVMNSAVIIGAATAVLGSILVSLDTDFLVTALHLPMSFGDVLAHRLSP
jgi:drug/metabolite transporter (DMT)-like permease